MKRSILVAASSALAIVAFTVSILAQIHISQIVFPEATKNRLHFTLIAPTGGGITIDKKSVKFDETNKLLTYTITYGSTSLVVSEQSVPSQFVDITTVYTKLVEGLNNYESFESVIGSVHLTKPTQLGGRQVAVLNSKGTLLFVKPKDPLTTDQWKVIFQYMEVIK